MIVKILLKFFIKKIIIKRVKKYDENVKYIKVSYEVIFIIYVLKKINLNFYVLIFLKVIKFKLTDLLYIINSRSQMMKL